MYVDADEIHIPRQLQRLKKLVLRDVENFPQFGLEQRQYIRFPDLYCPAPTNRCPITFTRNVKLPSYIRNRKELRTFYLSADKGFYYKHMSYCPKNPETLRAKLEIQIGSETGITIDPNWFNDVFMIITRENTAKFKNFSYIKEFPNHLPYIIKDE